MASTSRFPSSFLAVAILLLASPPLAADASAPTPEEAAAFVEDAEARLLEAWIASERASWVQSTYITHDTEILAAEAQTRMISLTVDLAQQAARFNDLDLDPVLRRKLDKIRLALTLPAPADPETTRELTRTTTRMESIYGSGEVCDEEGACRDLTELGRVMAESRDAGELLTAWEGWRTVSVPMQPLFERYVELANEGARELGFADVGAMWRSKYDMDPDAFARELERLWSQVRPLYEQLHCHVRARLNEAYGTEVVPPTGPIPAHVLGNMWAQQWGNVYELVAPPGEDSSVDVTALLVSEGVDEREMVRYGEGFFTSLGFEPLPDTFWERSMFTKPADRDVVCHASAWDIDWIEDLRIKMCIQITGEEFTTVHHELGHNFYYRAYNRQPPLFRDSANDGFHEAVGDAVALSITPAYLQRVGLLAEVPEAGSDVGQLLRLALDKVAFLPFGLLIDQWRWKVFSGEISPEDYNEAWWEMRGRYQGIRPPGERSADAFDPGAKYHVPANVPYTRYFLAHILQFQMHRALCEVAGEEGALHECSISGSEDAGRRLAEMLEMGSSRPWPEALETVAGSKEMDASAVLDYFAPLAEWLERENEGRNCGW